MTPVVTDALYDQKILPVIYVPFNCSSGTMTAIHQTNRLWNPASDFNSRGVATHVYDPNKSITWTTATYNFSAILLSENSLPNIFTIHPQFSCARCRFHSTSIQSVRVDDKICPNYLNDGTAASGVPYT